MYAIIETGGKQFRVEEGTKILVDRMAADVNSEVSLDKVLMVGGAELKVGAPYVENAKVTATVLDTCVATKFLSSRSGAAMIPVSCRAIVRTIPPFW